MLYYNTNENKQFLGRNTYERKIKKGFALLSLAATITFTATGLSACSNAETDIMETIGNGFIILNDQHPNIYKLHRFVNNVNSINESSTLCGYTLYYTQIKDIVYNDQFMFVLEKKDNDGNIISRQFNPYMKVITEGMEISPECYDEVCEECFPDLNK